ncbi:hypothetical protein O3M35_005403 [Rhynocoris fuscipes]|uniref:Uncharacterized protein n=1 Tax=Rhynocoris fuscipes TaxID=488301 RepID=A0AAW1DI12_9HEMI
MQKMHTVLHVFSQEIYYFCYERNGIEIRTSKTRQDEKYRDGKNGRDRIWKQGARNDLEFALKERHNVIVSASYLNRYDGCYGDEFDFVVNETDKAIIILNENYECQEMPQVSSDSENSELSDNDQVLIMNTNQERTEYERALLLVRPLPDSMA